jgi:hypothetical protein
MEISNVDLIFFFFLILILLFTCIFTSNVSVCVSHAICYQILLYLIIKCEVICLQKKMMCYIWYLYILKHIDFQNRYISISSFSRRWLLADLPCITEIIRYIEIVYFDWIFFQGYSVYIKQTNWHVIVWFIVVWI